MHAFVVAALTIFPAACLRAQQTRLAPTEIGQVADAAIGGILPSRDSLSRVSIANRKVILDLERTATAFGYGAGELTFHDLGIKAAVSPGSRALLSDCDTWGTKTCQQLGWATYVWIEPMAIATSTATVRVHVTWVDRGRAKFAAGTAPTAKGQLTGFVAEAQLARSGSGAWTFVARGAVLSGE